MKKCSRSGAEVISRNKVCSSSPSSPCLVKSVGSERVENKVKTSSSERKVRMVASTGSSDNVGAWYEPGSHKIAGEVYFRQLHTAVTTWWYTNRRTDLPWRQTDSKLPDKKSTESSVMKNGEPNPYEIWVSEVMSQQTQMITVIPYFERWIKRFPTVEALAAATEADVRGVWAGMGYYRRALYLLKGAQFLVQQHSQKKESHGSKPHHEKDEIGEEEEGVTLPKDAKSLQQVPGIGPYTAAAIASICYGEPVAAVDGNHVRVLSRLRCEWDFDPKKPQNIKRAFSWGDQMMHGGGRNKTISDFDPGAVNQGLMEIGSRICRPNGPPLCDLCPLKTAGVCGAYAAFTAGELPAIEGLIPLRATPLEKKAVEVVCVVHELVDEGVSSASAVAVSDGAKRGTRKGNPTVGKTAGSPSPRFSGEDLQRQFLLVRREETGLLGGMLECPSLTVPAGWESSTAKDTDAQQSLRGKPTIPKGKKKKMTPQEEKSNGETEEDPRRWSAAVRLAVQALSLSPFSTAVEAAAAWHRVGAHGKTACEEVHRRDPKAQKNEQSGSPPRKREKKEVLDVKQEKTEDGDEIEEGMWCSSPSSPTGVTYHGDVTHIFSHIRMTVHVYHCVWEPTPQVSVTDSAALKEPRRALMERHLHAVLEAARGRVRTEEAVAACTPSTPSTPSLQQQVRVWSMRELVGRDTREVPHHKANAEDSAPAAAVSSILLKVLGKVIKTSNAREKERKEENHTFSSSNPQ